MAYISTEQVAEIRKQLKKEFPAVKFSITRSHGTKVNVSVLEADFDIFADLLDPEHVFNNHVQVNHYYLDNHWEGRGLELLERIAEVAADGSYNRNANDPTADYGDMTFFVDISIGRWNKPFQVVK